jgi:hypothetical protein
MRPTGHAACKAYAMTALNFPAYSTWTSNSQRAKAAARRRQCCSKSQPLSRILWRLSPVGPLKPAHCHARRSNRLLRCRLAACPPGSHCSPACHSNKAACNRPHPLWPAMAEALLTVPLLDFKLRNGHSTGSRSQLATLVLRQCCRPTPACEPHHKVKASPHGRRNSCTACGLSRLPAMGVMK